MINKINRINQIAIFVLLIVLVFYPSNAKKTSTLNYQTGLINQIVSMKWMKDNLDYIKITTDRDAPVEIPLSKILDSIPQWTGKNSNYLHLLHNNQDIHFYLIDNNGVLDANDTLIFVGSRAYGDTTYWDNYATEEPFFVTYDDSYKYPQFKFISSITGNFNQEIVSTNLNVHIERDSTRSYGKDLYDSNNSDDEGWYWKELIPDESQPSLNTFTTPLLIQPIGTEPVNINLIFKSVTDTLLDALPSNKYPEYRVAVFFNGDSLENKQFTRIRKDSFMLSFTPTKIFNGVNSISVKSYVQHPLRLGAVSIAYINSKLNSSPYKDEYTDCINFSNIQTNSFVNYYGLKSPFSIAIDTINNTIQFPESFQNNPMLFASIKTNNPYFAVRFVDSTFYDFNPGFHLIKFNSAQNNFTQIYQWYYQDTLRNMIQSASDNDFFVIGYNGDNLIPQKYLNDLQNIGFTKAKNLKAGDSWLFIFTKSKVIFEDVQNNSNLAMFKGEIEKTSIKSYYAKILLPQSSSSSILVQEDLNFAHYHILKTSKPYLFDTTNSGNVLVVYNKYFESIAQRYYKLRESSENKLKLIDAEDIYNELNYGKKSPFAIKKFLQYSYNFWQDSIKTLVLIGNASWDPYRRLSTSIATDYIPTYGFPPADFWYSILDDDLVPDIAIGRISISTIDDGNNYIDKLTLYDQVPDQPWMKNFLFLSGGLTPDERKIFADAKSYFFDDYIKNPPFCGTSDSVAKYDNTIGGNAESGQIREKINQGALWVNFLGHANQSIFDMDGWQVNKLNNYAKYSFFSTISCNTGAHAEPGMLNSRNEDYVYFKDKGFIGSIGSSTFGWVDENRYIVVRIISQLADSNSKYEYMGDLENYGKNGLSNDGSQLETKYQNSLIGDPLLKLRVSKKPNLYIYSPEFVIVNNQGSPNVSVNDTLAIFKGIIYNNGFQTNSPIKLLFTDYYNNTIDTFSVNLPIICFSEAFVASLDISDKPGEHHLKIEIDPENKISSLKPENKFFEIDYYVYSNNLLMLDPFPLWNIESNNPQFRFINPKNNNNTNYFFSILQPNDSLLYSSSPDEIKIKENYLEWQPNIKLPNGNYIITAYYKQNDSTQSNPLQIPVSASSETINNGVKIKEDDKETFAFNTYNNIKFDSSAMNLKIQDNILQAKLVSVSGNDSTIEWGNIELGNNVFIDNRYYRGFNVVTIPIINSPDMIEHSTYRQFDTWVDGDNWTGDSSSVKLVQYLRDSIPDNVYVLIATTNRSFKIPVLNQMYNPTSVGSFDTLKTVMRTFGCRLFDSISGELTYPAVSWDGWKHSYAMIGKKGWKVGEAIEAMNPYGDSATIYYPLRFYQLRGSFETPFWGSSNKWLKTIVHSNASSDSSSNFIIQLAIVGRNNTQNDTINTFNLTTNTETIDLSDSIYSHYQQIKFVFNYQKSNIYSEPQVNSIEVNFMPVPELALKKSLCVIDDSLNQRGEKSIIHIGFENISKRSPAENIALQIDNFNNNGITNYYSNTFSQLNAGDSIEFELPLDNSNSSLINNYKISLNPNKTLNELYNFNNQLVLSNSVYEDTTKPQIDVTFDGKKVNDGDFVAKQPLIDIKVYDNSKFPISDSSKIEIFINGGFITPDITDFYYFNSINDNSNYKCQLIIKPKKLEFGNNLINPSNNIRIIAKDYSGNSDTVLYKLNVRQNNLISNFTVSPNPAQTQISLLYDFYGQFLSQYSVLDIYNFSGQLVKTANLITLLGNNNNKIDLYDNWGNNLPPGVYFYIFNVNSIFWTEPIKGTFLIIN
jgi:hypothetical protein